MTEEQKVCGDNQSKGSTILLWARKDGYFIQEKTFKMHALKYIYNNFFHVSENEIHAFPMNNYAYLEHYK